MVSRGTGRVWREELYTQHRVCSILYACLIAFREREKDGNGLHAKHAGVTLAFYNVGRDNRPRAIKAIRENFSPGPGPGPGPYNRRVDCWLCMFCTEVVCLGKVETTRTSRRVR